MKGRELLKKLINRKSIMTIIIVTIIAVLSGISVVQYNSHNVQTKLGEAQTTNYPFTGEQLIKAGAELSKGNVGYDCSGFVRQVILNCGASSVSATSTGPWHNGTATFVKNGVTYGLTTVQGITTKPQASSWFSVLNMNNLKPGDLVAGTRHIFIYVGYFSGNDGGIGSLKTYLKSLGIDANKVKIENRTSLRSNYWFIEGNEGTLTRDSTGKTIPVFRNYTWDKGRTGEGYSNNMDEIAVYRITTSEKNVKLKIVKKDMKTVPDTKDGATFEYWFDNETIKHTVSNNNAITIDNIKYGTSKSIWIQEVKAPAYFSIGLTKPIKLTISVDQNGTVSISKTDNGGQDESLVKKYFYGFYSDTKKTSTTYEPLNDCGEEVSVRIRDPENKNVKLKLVKKDMNNNTISNSKAQFTYWDIGTNDDGRSSPSGNPTGTTESEGTISLDNIKYGGSRYIWIKETKAPEGYAIGLKNAIKLKITVDQDGIITISKIHNGEGQNDIIGNYFYGFYKDGNHFTTKDTDSLKDCGENVSVRIKDPPITGQYDMQIVKKDETKNWDNGFNCSGGISDAVFSVKQFKNSNNYSNPVEWKNMISNNSSSNSVTTVSNQWKSVYDNVKITEQKSSDIYEIKEETPPKGYEKNTDTMYLKVTKKIENEKYVIDKVRLLNSATGDELVAESGFYTIESSNEYTILTHSSFKFKVVYNTTSIYIIIADPPLSSEYDLKIGKKSTETYKNNKDADYLKGAEYSVNIYDNKSTSVISTAKNNKKQIQDYLNEEYGSTKKSYQIKIAESGKAYSASNDNKIQGYGGTLYDYLVVQETKTPDNYIKDQSVYIVEVKRNIVENNGKEEVKIEDVKIYNNDGELIQTDDGEYKTLKTKDSSTFRVYFNGDTITFVHADKPDIKGNYTMSILKKSMEDNSDDLSTTIENVRFRAEQYKNQSTTAVIGHSKENNNLVTESGKKTDIYFENTNQIVINNTTKYDEYIIYEMDTPVEYQLSKLKLKLRVYKKVEGFKYKIDKITVVTADGKEVSANKGIITISEDNIQISNTASEYTAKIIASDTSVDVIFKNYRKGKYSLNARKIDQNGNPVTGAKFILNKGADTTKNLFGNGMVTNEGYTTTYTQEITKDNINDTDSYTLIEDTAPTGYSKLKYPINISITKDSSTYKIKKFIVKVNNSDVENECNIGASKTINDVILRDGSKAKLIVSVDTAGNIILNVENKEIEGKYSLDIQKKSTSDDFSTNGTTISGAKFEVKQYKNHDNDIIDTTKIGKEIVAYTGSDNIVKFNKDNDNDGNGNVLLNKDDVHKVDKYLIREAQSPTYYNKSEYFTESDKNYILIEVTKVKDDNDVIVIDHVNVYAYRYTQNGYVKEKITNMENAIKRGESAQSSGIYNICVKLSSSGTKLEFYGKNKQVQGEYDLNIGKKSTENYKNNNDADYLSGVQYSVNVYINKSGKVIDEAKNSSMDVESYLETYFGRNKKEYSINIDTAGKAYSATNNEKIKTGNTLYDYFIIQETKTPTNFLKDTNKYIIAVKRNIVGNDGEKEIKIEDVKIYNNNGNLIETSDGEYGTLKTKDSSTFRVYYNADTITFVHADTPDIKGGYTLDILKRSMEDNSDDLSKIMSGVSFNVKQYKNQSTSAVNGYSSGNSNVVIEANKKTDIYFGDTNVIKINDVLKYDEYTFSETSAPTGYEKSKLNLKLRVYKKREGFNYKISRVAVVTATGSEASTSNGIITISEENKQVSNNVTEYAARITVSDNSIGICWKDYRVGQYQLRAKKVDQYGNSTTGAIFRLNKGTDATNLLGNGMVYSSGANKGYTTIHTQKITKENVNDIDSYTLTEDTAPSGYLKLKYPIKISVVKDKSTYKLEKVIIKVNDSDVENECTLGNSKTINDVLLKNDSKVKLIVTINSEGQITLIVYNAEINGQYGLKIHKTINGNNASGITFNVTSSNTIINEKNIPTLSNGYTKTLERPISKANLIIEDNFTITENTPTDKSILVLKNPINLKVKKGLNEKQDAYIPTQIIASEDSEDGNSTKWTTISESETTTLKIPGVMLSDGKTTVDVVITIAKDDVNSNVFSITIDVENKTIAPKNYKLQIKKINSTNNSAILDRKFKVYKINSNGTRTDLTSSGPITSNGSGGIAAIDKLFKLENNTTDQYAIQEYYDDNYNNEYLKITNYEWILKINKTGKSLDTYALGTPTISHQLISGKTADSEQEEIAKKATVSKTGTDTATVTITIPNTKTTNFSFVVKKVDVAGNEVNGSNFTITRFARDENHGTESISGNPNEQKIITNNTLPGETYIFSVTENSAPTGYKKIFTSDPASGMGYLGISVNVLSNGNIEVGEINWHNEDAAIIEKYLKKTGKSSVVEVVNKGNEHKVVINIPNEEDTVPFSVSLNKHAYGSYSKKLSGIRFSVEKAVSNSDVKDISSAIGLLKNYQGFVTTETADSLIDKIDEANINTSYLYKITEEESTNPTNNYNCTIKSAIVKVYADSNKKVNISILAVQLNGSSEWSAYDTNTHGAKLSISGNGGNSFTIRWANEYKYSLELIKKSLNNLPKNTNGNIDWSNVTTTGDIFATFSVRQTKPTEKVLLSSKTFKNETIKNDDVKIGEKYEYEIVEEATSTGYSNIFKGITITLGVEMNSEQNISTTLKVNGTDQAYLLKFVKVKIENGTIYVYIVNPIDAYNVQLVKTTSNGEGIEGVTFNVFGKDSSSATFLPQTQIKTDSSGTAFVTDGIQIGKNYTIDFTEQAVPDGVTMLKDTTIELTINAANAPLTIDNVSVQAIMTGGNGTNTVKGLSVNVIDKTIIVTIPNEVNYSTFLLMKENLQGELITRYDKDDNKNIVSGVNVDISLSGPGVINNTVYSGYMSGTCSDTGGDLYSKRKLIGNSEYVYTIIENDAKNGYENIFNRWAIKLHIKTNQDGIIKPINENIFDQSNGNSYYEIVTNGSQQPYDIEFIKNYIKFELDTTDPKAQSIIIHLLNPPEYYIEVNKKDLNGKVDVVANINAYNRAQDPNNPICSLQNETTGIGIPTLVTTNGQVDTWEIEEKSAADPYINIFNGKKIYVKTKFENSKLSVLSYNVDGDENSELKNYIEVTTVKENMWKLVVTIKDPMKIKIRLNKVGNDGKGLSGAKLTITDTENNQTETIDDGLTSTEYMEREVGVGDTLTYKINEIRTASGHVNILGDKTLLLVFRVNESKTLNCVQKTVMDKGQQVTGDELKNILKYISISQGKDGRTRTIDVTVTNPLEYKFKLLKVDSAGNPLDGTQISVESSLSGTHYIDGKTSLEFTEEQVSENSTINYTISELYTKGEDNNTDTPYVNVLGSSKIKLVAQVSESGKLSITKSYVLRDDGDGKTTEVALSEFGVTLKQITTDENGIQSIEIVIENSVKFNVELNKLTSGNENTPIPSTKFTIISSASGSHTNYTNINGKIELSESNVKAGDYTIKVFEDKPANEKYINVLETNYVEINVNVSGNGEINFKDKNKKYKICSPNGNEITDADKVAFYEKYVSVDIDKSSAVNKIIIKIKNPLCFKFGIKKVVANTSTGLKGAKFNITSSFSNKTYSLTTLDDEICNVEEKYVDPGVYKYEITEIESSSKVYNNILKGYNIIVYVKIDGTGTVTYVADENGTPFSSVPLMQRYYLYKDGVAVGSTEEGQKIKNLVRLEMSYGDIPEAVLNVGNPIEYKVDLVKLDSESKEISGATFEVKRWGDTIFNKAVSDKQDDIEITESNMNPGMYSYYITEKEIRNYSGVYTNVFKNKAIMVNTTLNNDGTLTINKNSNGDKFEIYSIDNGMYTLLDKSDESYKYVKDVTVSKNSDGISILKVEIKDPTKYKVKILKYNAENATANGSKFTLIQEDSTGKVTTLLNNEYLRDIEINPAEAGNYIYYVTENSTPTNDDSKPGAQYINVLKNKYAKIYVHLSADGKLTITNSNFVGSEKYYELYEGDINTRNGKKISNDELVSVSVDARGTSSTEKTLVIRVVNPVTYNLDIVKQDTTGISLANSKFKVRRQVVSTNSNDKIFDDTVTDKDKIEVTENRMLAGNYIYYIKEVSSPATKYCNILEDGYLKLYVKVSGDGKVTLTNSKFEASTSYYEWRKGNIDDPKDTDTLVATSGPMGRFVRAYVQESNNIYTIRVEVKNPLKLEFGIHKVVGNSYKNIPNVKFNITNSIWGNTETVITGKDGLASISEEDVSAGIYKFEITEIETGSEIYNNVLEGYKVVVYLRITGDGTITYVSDEDGTEFSSAVAADKRFHVYKDNTNVDATKEGKAIISLVSLKTQDGDIPKSVLKVGNTLNYKMDLIKKDTENNTLTGSIFSVNRSNNLIYNGEVTSDTEITEKNMLPGTYEYYITENSISNKGGTYVNVFKNKAIKIILGLGNDGTLTVIDKSGKKFEICSVSDGKYTVLNDDIAYQYVKNIEITKDSNGVNIIQVEVENPTNYNFNVIKKDAAENNVKGSKFTAYREDSNGNIKQVLNNEELKIINETPMRAGNYIYYITETATPGKQYVNVLEGKYMKVYVHLDANGRLSITNSKFQVADNYYEIYKGDISKRDGTKVENSEFISVNVSGPQNNVYTLNVVVTNPVKINTNIIKKDTSNNDLASSHFKVRRQDVSTKTFSDRFEGEVTSGIEKTESPMRAGNYIYYVTEKSSPSARYTNILEKTYLKIYVKISGDGKVVITDSKFNESAGYYEWYNGDINNPKDSDTKIDKSDPRNQYIKDISTSVEDSIYTVNVTVVNPVKIRVNVNKKIFGDDEVNLQNVEIKAETPDGFTGVVTKVTDKDGNISFIDQYANAGLRRYLVTEAKPAGEEFVNVLEHKEILVYTIVKADGTFQIVDEDGVPTENKWYAYNNTDSNNKVKLNENTDVIKNFVKVSQSVGKDGISELNFAIKNPQKYKLHLRKIDKDNKKGMNGVTFDLSVSDGKNIVKLRNANTLENMNTEGLVTSTVDGADGVIEINDILIEKSGTYTYTLHEHSTDGIFDWLYKNHKDDIILRIKIVVRDGKYVIENLETVQGGDYVGDLSIATGIGSTIKNERIKGKYDLILNKVDSYTEKALDGAVFNIHVEKDGKEHTLYKSTEDVDSMEQILPVDNVVVKDGKLEIKDIRIEEIGRDRLEEYTIVLTEVTAPKGYMLLDAPIKLKVTTNTTGKFDDEKYIVESVELVDDENHGLVTFDYNENKIVVTAKNEYFDLALRKSITSVAYPDTNEGEITEEETKDRIPEVITDGINEGPNGEDPTETTAVYNHKKNPVRAYKEQEVIYTLRVYNEGEIDGYAEEITDHLPEWLEFVDDDFNKERGWSLDENDETGRTVRTKNLSKAYADENGVDNLIKAKNKVTGDLDSKEIQIKCRVSEKAKLKTVLTNIAEISLSKADDRTSETVDRDSVTNNVKIPETSEEMSKYKDDELNKTYVPGQEDDDDFEKVIVEAFDLSLRKYITAVNDEQMLKDNTDTEDKKQNTQDKNNESTKDENSENTGDKNKVTNDESTNNETTKDEGQEKTDDSQEGNNNDEEQKDTVDDNSADLKYAREPLINIKDLRDKPDDVTTATYTHTKEPVEVSVDDIVTYTISVYNEGTVSGYASLIKDDIPEGLEYVKDSEINKKFNWKLLDENNKETDDVKKAKYIVSDYLSKENGDDNILNAFNGEKLDTKYVQVDFKVICKQDWAKIIKNEAQISDDQDDRGKPVRDRDSTPNEWKGEDDEDVEYIRVTYMDLALRKFITGVNKQIITDRIPEVDATALKNKENTTADYKHTKEPVIVHTNDTVIYTIRVYNEGSKDGYATQIKDDIPEGLEFIPYNETNKMYEWKMLDAEGKETLDVSKVKSVVTNYCSKDKETEKRQNLMLAFERPDGTTFDTPEYKDVKIAFKVVEPTTSDRILINHAQISEQTDKKGIHREDRDSTPNEWKGEDDEDIEKVRVLYFDLALRKWVTNTMVTENGQTFVTETGHHAEDDPEEVVKVDLKKSKINSVVVKFEYKVRITNEGEIAGYAKEIKDRIPDGLEFEEADNPNWKMLEDGTVVTDELKDKLLQPGESAEVIIVLKWINSPTNLGVKINFAEISKDHNDYGTPDIDSTPNNNVPGEDDIDDAPVMLTVKTGSQDLKYMLAILVVLTALVGSVSLLKKNLQKNKYN